MRRHQAPVRDRGHRRRVDHDPVELEAELLDQALESVVPGQELAGVVATAASREHDQVLDGGRDPEVADVGPLLGEGLGQPRSALHAEHSVDPGAAHVGVDEDRPPTGLGCGDRDVDRAQGLPLARDTAGAHQDPAAHVGEGSDGVELDPRPTKALGVDRARVADRQQVEVLGVALLGDHSQDREVEDGHRVLEGSELIAEALEDQRHAQREGDAEEQAQEHISGVVGADGIEPARLVHDPSVGHVQP